jgi:hypothetical protein
MREAGLFVDTTEVAKEETMSDFHHDPNVPRNGFEDMQPYEKRIQWAAVGVLLLLCGGIFVAALFFSGDTQTAMNSPAAETTGSAANMPAPPPQLRK